MIVFSFQEGIFHPYYVSALAPAVAALSGGGLVVLWRWAKASWAGVAALGATTAGSAALAVALLERTPEFAPWLRTGIPAAAVVAILGAVALRVPGRLARRVAATGAVALAIALAAGPAGYSVATAGRALNGNNVLAGPASAASQGGPGGGGGPMGGGAAGRAGGPPSTSAGSAGGPPSASTARPTGGGGGGLSSTTIAYLEAHQGSAKYLVAATGSQTTAGIIIATGKPVVTIGGFNGGDPAPTASDLAEMVAAGELRYVLLSGDGGGGPGGNSSSELTAWVKAHGTVVEDAGTTSGTLYAVEV